ncbi:hypothetical protein FDP41_002201 [Naegleria fowleri]|uniref:Amine oxidase domain-containing protein n=1 Tax=Naegleria fowleri TaxID=5763 RepID=A0A6A5BXA5_NAEFO|nr:uncharacterized protein FDP41_002201 [Naegleria fowleri]KAF0979131.1 hypothetical protein FDP41_002201 [Naegleria fowleri]
MNKQQTLSSHKHSRHHYKICIIGGGAAGLTAANTLAENDQHDFMVLEASERIGGRVCSNRERGIELGGEFVHGEGSILWDVLVNKLKIPLKVVFNFSATNPKDCGLGFLLTDNALHMTDEEIKQHFRKFIQKTYHLNDNNDGYLGGDIRNWQNIHHVAGAYSFALTTDASKRHYIEQPRVVLGQPIDSKIYFAGEAYCQHSPATIHGAMETGQKVALEILKSSQTAPRMSKL